MANNKYSIRYTPTFIKQFNSKSINQEKLESVINYINNDNVAISVFKPKENQE